MNSLHFRVNIISSFTLKDRSKPILLKKIPKARHFNYSLLTFEFNLSDQMLEMNKIILFLLIIPSIAFSQSYKKLHQKAILIDIHNDVLSTVTMKGLNIENDLTGKSHSDINRFKKGGVDIQVFSIFCDERFRKDTT